MACAGRFSLWAPTVNHSSKRALPRVHENLENLPPHRRTASTFALGKQVRDPGSGPEANSLLRGRSQFS